MHSSSSSLSHSTLAAIICICTGAASLPSILYVSLTPPRSSLVTGAKSHKLVTSEVSRILWFYYNDPVRPSNLMRNLLLTISRLLDNTFPHLCRERTLLCFPLPYSLGIHTDYPPRQSLSPTVGDPNLAAADCSHLLPSFRTQKHYQHGPALEGFQDFGRS